VAARDTFRSQLGPFAMVPVWVLQEAHDAQAVYLYAILSRYANRERRAWPKHDRLASDMGVTDRSVRRALAVLKRIKAVQTLPHRRADGTIDGTEYLLVAVPESHRTPVSGSPRQRRAEPPPVVVSAPVEPRPPDTNVRLDRTPVSAAYKEELDPSNQIQERQRESALPLPMIGRVFTGSDVDRHDPCERFRLGWNATIVEPLKPCQTLTPIRRRHIRAALVSHSTETWGEIFARVAASSFCRGEKGWIASFDWLIATPDAAVKVLEGQYDDHVTDSEIRAAAQHLGRTSGGRCPHDPACPDRETCYRTFALQLRARRAS